jgi:hypothetical protein
LKDVHYNLKFKTSSISTIMTKINITRNHDENSL